VTDIFREVDEEVRKDKLLALWRKYGLYAVVALVIILGGSAAYVLWQDYRTTQARETGGAFQSAIVAAANGRTEEAASTLQSIAEEGTAGYRALAQFRLASLREGEGNTAAALELYDRLAGTSGVDPDLAAVARFKAALLVMDTGTIEEAKARLEPLLTPDYMLYNSARELMAVLEIKEGDLPAAREHLKNLVDEAGVPFGVKNRASQLLAAIGDSE
jgi:hypothetical protein